MIARYARGLAVLALLLGAALAVPSDARAQDLVYQPKNPAFGGSPINYQWMLSSANAQKSFDQGRDPFARNPLEDFQRGLQRQILNQLSRELIADRFGEDLDLSQPGRFEIGQFTVEITPGPNGVSIQVLNALSGEQTTITIPQF